MKERMTMAEIMKRRIYDINDIMMWSTKGIFMSFYILFHNEQRKCYYLVSKQHFEEPMNNKSNSSFFSLLFYDALQVLCCLIVDQESSVMNIRIINTHQIAATTNVELNWN